MRTILSCVTWMCVILALSATLQCDQCHSQETFNISVSSLNLNDASLQISEGKVLVAKPSQLLGVARCLVSGPLQEFQSRGVVAERYPFWKVNGEPLDWKLFNESRKVYTIRHSASSHLIAYTVDFAWPAQLTKKHEGTYTCGVAEYTVAFSLKIYDDRGPVISTRAVLQHPGPGSTSFVPGQSTVSLVCQATGFPPMNITWQRGRKTLKSAFTRTLALDLPTFSPSQEYTCTAQNFFGRTQVVLTESQFVTPAVPVSVTRDVMHPRQLRLFLKLLPNPDTRYMVSYRAAMCELSSKCPCRGTDCSLAKSNIMLDGSSPVVVLDGLRPATQYQLSVAAVGDLGVGARTVLSATTPEDLSEKPADLSIAPLSETAVHVTWKMPYITNGNVTHFKLIYWITGTPARLQEVRLGGLSREFTIHGLAPRVNYTTSLAAVNSAGPGNSETIIFTMFFTPEDTSQATKKADETSVLHHELVGIGIALALFLCTGALTALVVCFVMRVHRRRCVVLTPGAQSIRRSQRSSSSSLVLSFSDLSRRESEEG